MNGAGPNRSSSANHSATSVNIGSTRTPRPARRTRTRSPSNLNSRGRRTAWLRPLRKSLAVVVIEVLQAPWYIPKVYIMSRQREVTYRNGQAGVIGQALQFEFPEPETPPIAPAGVRRDQDRGGGGIEPTPFVTPPAPDRRHGKRARVVIGAEIDESRVPPEVVDAVWIGPG